MARVTGIGGFCFKSKGDPVALAAWYQARLRIRLEPWEPKLRDEKNESA